ncbi:GNAT family N-acetyltransferase [Cyclobacterium amurskyense]|uniref:GNAT family N-acetyltransferase n=1 Tax=Cyclobacterium amurskyense TaxID=320787 RepID=UPI0030D7428B|tara:strand:+ start:6579 stop:7061 length:483 start_codon:yes stop_codon:yes gene_type:complete
MIKLRPATIKDLELLKFWDKQQHVIDCDPDEDWDWEKELARKPAWREQLVAELNDDPIGFVQIIDPYEEETHYWGDIAPNKRAIDIWIGEERNLNKGYGTAIMKLAIELCFSQTEVDGILIDPLKSNTKAHKFYEKIGFEFVEERVFNDTVCYVYELKPR